MPEPGVITSAVPAARERLVADTVVTIETLIADKTRASSVSTEIDRFVESLLCLDLSLQNGTVKLLAATPPTEGVSTEESMDGSAIGAAWGSISGASFRTDLCAAMAPLGGLFPVSQVRLI